LPPLGVLAARTGSRDHLLDDDITLHSKEKCAVWGARGEAPAPTFRMRYKKRSLESGIPNDGFFYRVRSIQSLNPSRRPPATIYRRPIPVPSKQHAPPLFLPRNNRIERRGTLLRDICQRPEESYHSLRLNKIRHSSQFNLVAAPR